MNAGEKYIEGFTTENGIEYGYVTKEIALKAISIARKEVIDKACEWLDGVIWDYIELQHANVDNYIHFDQEKFINDLIKAINEE